MKARRQDFSLDPWDLDYFFFNSFSQRLGQLVHRSNLLNISLEDHNWSIVKLFPVIGLEFSHLLLRRQLA